MKWISRAALEYIGQAGLGYSFDALDDSKKNEYAEAIKLFVYVRFFIVAFNALAHCASSPTSFRLFFIRQFVPTLTKFGAPKFWRAVVDLIPSEVFHRLRDIVDIMDKTSRRIFQQKKEALEKGDEEVLNQVGKGKDILSILSKVPLPNIVHDQYDAAVD